jgi:uroporphyrinogen-III synthase
MMQWEAARILITRPADQAQGLIQRLSEKGAAVLFFPTLHIIPVADTEALKQRIEASLEADWYLFISPNAVDHSLPLIVREGWLPRMQGQFGSVGAGTRDLLAVWGVHQVLYPMNAVGALALLETLGPETLENKSVAVFKGDSGNPTLEEGLLARGARVLPIICYQRQRTQEDPQPLIEALAHHRIDLIVVTSGDGLQSLIDLVPVDLAPTLRTLPLVVISERLKSLAESAEFSTILLAKDASDEAIVMAIAAWQGESHD